VVSFEKIQSRMVEFERKFLQGFIRLHFYGSSFNIGMITWNLYGTHQSKTMKYNFSTQVELTSKLAELAALIPVPEEERNNGCLEKV